MGMAGAIRKANFAAPVRGAYTGVGAARTANRPVAELGNWSTTYTNSYEVQASPRFLSFSFFCNCDMRVQLHLGPEWYLERVMPVYSHLTHVQGVLCAPTL